MESILNLIKKFTSNEVNSTPEIAQENKPTAIEKTTEVIIDVLKKVIAEGKNDKVVKILMGKEPIPDNSIVGEVINKLKDSFSEHMKMTDTEAQIAAGKIVPGVMGSLANKTDNGEQLRDIMQTLGGDLMGDIEGKFGKYLKDDDKNPLKSLF
jgi:delta-aminolevulinic acid dehydratase/porphobilinogen synthase